jgi:hypothetical protein
MIEIAASIPKILVRTLQFLLGKTIT